MDMQIPGKANSRPAPDRHRLLFEPNSRIHGLIGDQTVLNFLEDLKSIRDGGEDIYVEIDTPGGDADAARRIALELQLFQRHSAAARISSARTPSIPPASPFSPQFRGRPGSYAPKVCS